MDPVLKWTGVDFVLNSDRYLHALIAFLADWRARNPDSFDIIITTVPAFLVWFVYKTPWKWDESILKAIFDKLKIPWKDGKGGADNGKAGA